MAGHSKWKQIKHKKEIKDQKRGQLFSKLSRLITLAVGESDAKLRFAVEQAKAANMPKENIERAVAKGRGPEKDALKEVVYEAFGPGGINLLIHTTTDNPNRTLSEVRSLLNKHGGKLGVQGSVSYLYDADYNPIYTVAIENKETAKKILNLMETLENHDDVQHVYSNFDIPEGYMK